MRLTVDLDESEYRELTDAAAQERRDPRDEIVVLAMSVLRKKKQMPMMDAVRLVNEGLTQKAIASLESDLAAGGFYDAWEASTVAKMNNRQDRVDGADKACRAEGACEAR